MNFRYDPDDSRDNRVKDFSAWPAVALWMSYMYIWSGEIMFGLSAVLLKEVQKNCNARNLDTESIWSSYSHDVQSNLVLNHSAK